MQFRKLREQKESGVEKAERATTSKIEEDFAANSVLHSREVERQPIPVSQPSPTWYTVNTHPVILEPRLANWLFKWNRWIFVPTKGMTIEMQFFVFYSSITFHEIRSNLLALFFISFLLFLFYVIIQTALSPRISIRYYISIIFFFRFFFSYVKKMRRNKYSYHFRYSPSFNFTCTLFAWKSVRGSRIRAARSAHNALHSRGWKSCGRVNNRIKIRARFSTPFFSSPRGE